MHIRVSVMNVWCIRVSRGLPASSTRRSWNAMSSSPTSAGVGRAAAICSTISSSTSPAAAWSHCEDLAGGGALDRLARQVHVADVVRGHVDDEQPAVADRDQQAFLGQPLHALAERAAADAELAGQVGLAELGAGLELPVADGLAQFVGDDARRRLLHERLDEVRHCRSPERACPSPAGQVPVRAAAAPSRRSPGWR